MVCIGEGGLPNPPSPTGTRKAGGTYPTGMHSCWFCTYLFEFHCFPFPALHDCNLWVAALGRPFCPCCKCTCSVGLFLLSDPEISHFELVASHYKKQGEKLCNVTELVMLCKFSMQRNAKSLSAIISTRYISL